MSKHIENLRIIEGQLQASGLKFGIIASRFNSFITEQLVSGAVDCLLRHGALDSDITLVHVPGSLEIALAAKRLAKTGKVDAIVALGAVIRGATTHYEVVCNETAKGLTQVSLETGIPIGFGVLTTETVEQAIERAGTKSGNKGADAALAALEMAQVIRSIQG